MIFYVQTTLNMTINEYTLASLPLKIYHPSFHASCTLHKTQTYALDWSTLTTRTRWIHLYIYSTAIDHLKLEQYDKVSGNGSAQLKMKYFNK